MAQNDKIICRTNAYIFCHSSLTLGISTVKNKICNLREISTENVLNIAISVQYVIMNVQIQCKGK